MHDTTTTGRADTAAPTTAPAPAARTLDRLHADETGAQAMEYAALAAGGCGAVGVLVTLLQSEPVISRVSGLVTGLLDHLGGVLGL